jgi:hypothetical protein
MGHLIPAGTGYPTVRGFQLKKSGSDANEADEAVAEAPARETDQKKQRVEENRAEALRLLDMD